MTDRQMGTAGSWQLKKKHDRRYRNIQKVQYILGKNNLKIMLFNITQFCYNRTNKLIHERLHTGG